MILPQSDGKTEMNQTKEMADNFIKAWFTYFDTAYVYEDVQYALDL